MRISRLKSFKTLLQHGPQAISSWALFPRPAASDVDSLPLFHNSGNGYPGHQGIPAKG